jgi:hypothetical protein
MRTKRVFSIFCLVAMLACVGAAAALAADEHHAGNAEMTVRGEILDMACYLPNEAKGPDHAGCAKRCVQGGQPMGLLAEDGTVYLLYASHGDDSAFDLAKKHAGEKVELKGAESNRAGIKGLEVHAVKPL